MRRQPNQEQSLQKRAQAAASRTRRGSLQPRRLGLCSVVAAQAESWDGCFPREDVSSLLRGLAGVSSPSSCTCSCLYLCLYRWVLRCLPSRHKSLPPNEMWRRWPETSEWLVKGNSPNLAHRVVRRLKSHLRGPHGEEPCEGASWKPQYLPTPTPSHEADASAATSWGTLSQHPSGRSLWNSHCEVMFVLSHQVEVTCLGSKR